MHTHPDDAGGALVAWDPPVSALTLLARTLLGHSQEWFYRGPSVLVGLCFSGNAQDFCGADGVLSWLLAFFIVMSGVWGGGDGEGAVSSVPSSRPELLP